MRGTDPDRRFPEVGVLPAEQKRVDFLQVFDAGAWSEHQHVCRALRRCKPLGRRHLVAGLGDRACNAFRK